MRTIHANVKTSTPIHTKTPISSDRGEHLCHKRTVDASRGGENLVLTGPVKVVGIVPSRREQRGQPRG